MSLGSIFWPQSVCAKLGKNTNFQYYNKRSLVRSMNTPKTDITLSKNIENNNLNSTNIVNVDDENDTNKQEQDRNINDNNDNLETISDGDEKSKINPEAKENIDNTFNHSSINIELSVDDDNDDDGDEEGEDQDQEAIHNKTIDSVVSSDSEQDKNESTVVLEMSSENKATLICLPYRFLWWLTTHNPGFIETSQSSSILTSTVFSKSDDSGNTNNNNKSGTSPLNWIQSLASRRLNANLSSNDSVKKFIHVLPEPRRRKRLVQQQLKRINATLRGQQQQLNYTGGNCLSKSLILPPRGLTNDGLDQLWAHPNRIPLEIYADFDTTQLILTNLHHMLALWLYGQSLAGTSVQSFIQAPIVYLLPNGRPANMSTSDSANSRPYPKSNRHNTDQPDYWTLMPGRQDAFLNSLRQPFHIPLLPGGIPNFGSSTTGPPNYSTPMLPDRSNCTNLAQPFFYPRYPLINWHGIANNKYSGQTMTSDRKLLLLVKLCYMFSYSFY
ncbi:unnamed protein product [Schistosoma margrebowiei]|uniref:Uncharacterized protein n=1 Tax=Schistosoma margrebowiei TaxID=48269 RepID=A0A183M044_9TREM|nr:unnamed protein product [Schistosoma margrebowiei]